MESVNGNTVASPQLNQLLQQLSEPNTASAVKNILQHAELLALLVGSLDGAIRRSEEITGNIGEALQEFAGKNNNGNGHREFSFAEDVPPFVASLPALMKTGNKVSKLAETKEFDELLNPAKLALLKNLSDKLDNPQTLEALDQIVANAPVIAFLTSALSAFLARSEQLLDNINEVMHEAKSGLAQQNTADLAKAAAELPKMVPPLVKSLPTLTENLPTLSERLPSLMKTGLQLGEIAESDGVQAFLNSGMLTPELVNFLGDVGKTVIQTEQEFRQNPKRVTVYGLYKATRDEDVQHGLGFLIEIARNFGKMMKK